MRLLSTRTMLIRQLSKRTMVNVVAKPSKIKNEVEHKNNVNDAAKLENDGK